MALGRHHTPMPAGGGIHPISSLYEDLKNTTDIQQQRNIRDEIDRLDREIRRARIDVSDAEVRLNTIQREVDSFRQQIY